MAWQFTILSTPILLAWAVSLFLCGYIATFYRQGRRDPLVVLYFWITVAAMIWTGFSALKLLHTDPATKLLFYRLLHVGAAALPPLLFLFVVVYTDRTHWLGYETLTLVFLLPAVFIGLLFLGPDGLIIVGTRLIEGDLVVLRVEDGPGFIIFSLYSAILVVASLGIVLAEIRRVGPTYYPQAGLIGLAILVPIAFSLLTTIEILPFADDRINLVPTAGAVSVGAFGVLLFRYRLVDLPPLAYTTAMRYSPDALFVLDSEGRILHANDHGRELLDRLNGRMRQPFTDVLPAIDPETNADELVELSHPDGEATYHRVFAERLSRGGRHIGWVVVLRDETVQQQQQQQLQRQNEQLELLASTISHDLRNPLSVAQGYLRNAQNEVDSEHLDRVMDAHGRMAEIIDAILTLARAGKQIDELEPVPLDAIIEQAWTGVQTPQAELSLQVDGTVMADQQMLLHVFENVFRNAVEHGGPDVTVTVGPLNNGIYVEDDGPGISPEERETVFEVGYTTTTEGTGFGLNIIKQIVEAHDWELDLTAGSAGGARFEITGLERVTPNSEPGDRSENASESR